MVDTLVVPLLKIIILLNAVLVAVTYMVLLERKVIAWVQSRLGPMRVGPYGSLQQIADAIKLMIKEDITPTPADRRVFTAAPSSLWSASPVCPVSCSYSTLSRSPSLRSGAALRTSTTSC